MTDTGVSPGRCQSTSIGQVSGDLQMDQAFARPWLRHVECLHLCRDLARVIVDAGLVLLRNINHCD